MDYYFYSDVSTLGTLTCIKFSNFFKNILDVETCTGHKMKYCIKDFFSNCDQIYSFQFQYFISYVVKKNEIMIPY